MIRPTVALATLALLLTPLADAALSFGTFGSFVDTVGDDDFIVKLENGGSNAFCIGYLDDPSDEDDETDRAWFFHIATDGDCSGESVDDDQSYQITKFGGTRDLGWVTSSDTSYVDESFDAIGSVRDRTGSSYASDDWLCYLESDGIPGFTRGDPLYVDVEEFDGSATPTLSKDDLRLLSVSSSDGPFSLNPGIVDSTSDDDFETADDTTDDTTILPNSKTLTCPGEDIRVRVLNIGRTSSIDDNDVYYFVGPLESDDDPRSEDFAIQTIARFTDATGLDEDERVADGDNDHEDFLVYLQSNESTADPDGFCDACVISLVRDNDDASTESDILEQELWLHFDDPDGTDDDILMHDLLLRDSTSFSAGSDGTLVDSESDGANTDIHNEGSVDLWSIEALAYYIDDDNDGTFDAHRDPVYIKHPYNADDGDLGDGACSATEADGERCLEEYDIRVAVDVSGVNEAEGSLVEDSNDDDDWLEWEADIGYTGFVVKVFSEEFDTRVPLKALTNAKFVDQDSDDQWDANETIVLSSNSTITQGDTLIWNGVTEAAVNTAIDCDGSGGDDHADCGDTLETGKVKVSGPDTTWDSSDSEYVYWSNDAWLTHGDHRIHAPGSLSEGPGSSVDQDDADMQYQWLQSSDVKLYLSYDPDCAADSTDCDLFPKSGDIELYPNFGNRLDNDADDVVPTLQELGAGSLGDPVLAQYDPGDAVNPDDRAYYLDFSKVVDSSADAFDPDNVLRISPFNDYAAGTFLLDVAKTANERDKTKDTQSAAADTFFYIMETGLSSSGFDANDLVYLNLPTDWDGNAGTTLTRYDIRATANTYESDTYKAGGFVYVGAADFQDFGNDAFATSGFRIMWWDTDNDDEVDDDDMLWLTNGTTAPTYPGYLDIRFKGSGGATGDAGDTTSGSTTTTTSSSTTTTTSTSDTSTSTETVTVTQSETTSDSETGSETTTSESDTDTTTSESDTDTTTDENTTDATNTTDEVEQPAPGVVLVLAMVGVAAVMARRRGT